MAGFATAGYRTERLGALATSTPANWPNTRKTEESARNQTLTASLPAA